MTALAKATGIPEYDLIQAEDVNTYFPELIPTLNGAVSEYEDTLQGLLDSDQKLNWSQVLPALTEICRPLNWAWGAVSHLVSVRNTKEFREAQQAQLPLIMEFGSRLSQSKTIYRALLNLRDNCAGLDYTQMRILNSEIDGMVKGGVGFDGDAQVVFNDANQRKAELSSKFSNNVLDATNEWSCIITDDESDGIPNRVLDAIRQEDGTYKLTLDGPTYGPVLTHATSRTLRERVYIAQVSKAECNEPILAEILELRQSQAERMGYANWAEVSLSEKMADNVDEIEVLFEDLVSAATPIAIEDKATVLDFAKSQGFDGDELKPWDGGYYADKLIKSKFDLDYESLRPYFPFEQVLDGLFNLTNRLFGVTVVAADGEAPVWHPDVRFFNVLDTDGEYLASFFLDPYARPGEKRGGAWMNDCVNRSVIDGEVTKPIAYLICNQTPPAGDKPSLMSFGEVTTLFHEFGHGLQHMLTTVDYASASGINLVDWDAVELPSQFMENWCLDEKTLYGMAKHFETGEPLPVEEYQKLKDTETFLTAGGTLRQAYLALTDLRLHYQYDSSVETPDQLRRRVADEVLLTPPIDEDRNLCAFGHIFAGGYSAGYYSYKWAEVMSADAFAAFEEAGLDDEAAVKATGKRFRDTV